MSARLGPEAMRLVDAASFAQLATLMPDGAPKVDTVWVGRDGHHVLVATDGKSLKAQNVERDPRVALVITAFDDPYEQLLIRGRVVEVRDDPELEVLDALSMKYLGEPFARRRWSRRIVLVIEPDIARHARSPLRDPRTTTRDRDPSSAGGAT